MFIIPVRLDPSTDTHRFKGPIVELRASKKQLAGVLRAEFEVFAVV